MVIHIAGELFDMSNSSSSGSSGTSNGDSDGVSSNRVSYSSRSAREEREEAEKKEDIISSLMQDISLLHTLGIKLVLVADARPQLDRRLQAAGDILFVYVANLIYLGHLDRFRFVSTCFVSFCFPRFHVRQC